MKIQIDKEKFLKCWSMVERCAGTTNRTIPILGSVLLVAEYGNVELRATDIKTSIICKGQGVEVIEPGAAAFPVKGVSELFDKAQGDSFTIDVTDARAVMSSGKSRYRFMTFPVSDFPKLPSSSAATLFCSIKAGELALALNKGTLCADIKASYPHYLAGVLFELSATGLAVVTTDQRRLALYRVDTDSSGDSGSMLLPMSGIRELQKVLGSLPDDADVRIVRDDAQAYFLAGEIEQAIRMMEGKFPRYERLLGSEMVSSIDVEKEAIVSAAERVNVVVRDFNRTICMKQSAVGNMLLFGRAAEFGDAIEHIPSTLDGDEMLTAFHSRFFLEALKAVEGDTINLTRCFKTPNIIVSAKGSDRFQYLLAPLEIDKVVQETIDSMELTMKEAEGA